MGGGGGWFYVKMWEASTIYVIVARGGGGGWGRAPKLAMVRKKDVAGHWYGIIKMLLGFVLGTACTLLFKPATTLKPALARLCQ